MTDRKRKSPVILLSSSSEEEEDDEDCELEDEEEVDEEIRTSENEGDFTDEDEDEEEEESYSCEFDEESGSDHGANDGGGGGENEESLCKRVIRLLKEGSDLEALQLKECKAYLRMYGLRLAGTKAVCIQRIKEHCRIKDGDGEVFYPRSSFVINCRGDVCEGDVILFSQKVYERFDKVTRHGKLVGRRTVAGRVIKESYGSAKQQHTFTVEVLWSKGIKPLPPLFPLLVKGRNLYRLKTFRQRWANEAERITILAEKHKRGTVARLVRARKKSRRMGSPNRGLERQRCSNYTRPFQMGKTANLERRNNVKGHRKGMLRHSTEFSNHGQGAVPSRRLKCTRTPSSEGLNSSWSYLKDGHHNNAMGPNNQSYSSSLHNQYFPQKAFESRGGPIPFSGYGMSSSATGTEFLPFRHYAHFGMRN
uniref:Uncharacterized protein n=1 Tax=Rhizophora mucronata TaxID=61149 RepID=A0A2P2KNZ9_RHIMU